MTNPITALRDWWAMRATRREWSKAPATLDAAVERLLTEVPADLLAEFKTRTRADCITGFGWGSGMCLRNSWGLWHGETAISRELTAAGIQHGDDKSAVVFTALWCRLNGAPFNLAVEAEHYRAYWLAMGCNPDGSPIPGMRQPISWTIECGPDGEQKVMPEYD